MALPSRNKKLFLSLSDLIQYDAYYFFAAFLSDSWAGLARDLERMIERTSTERFQSLHSKQHKKDGALLLDLRVA